MYELGSALIKEIDRLLNELADEVYQLLKLWEPAVIGKICRDDPNTTFSTPYNNTIKEIRDFPNATTNH